MASGLDDLEGDRDQRQAKQPMCAQTRRLLRCEHDRHVVGRRMRRRTRVARLDAQVEIGTQVEQRRELRYEELAREERRQRETHSVAPALLCDAADRFVETSEQRFDFLEQPVTCSGELERASAAHEQAHLELVLEIEHLVADRGRREVQLLGGSLETQPAGRDAEDDTIDEAIKGAEREGVSRKELTPFLLKRIFELTEGKSLVANIALVGAHFRTKEAIRASRS